jgi:hypothetical protein
MRRVGRSDEEDATFYSIPTKSTETTSPPGKQLQRKLMKASLFEEQQSSPSHCTKEIARSGRA